MRPAVVLDTNVAIAANGSTPQAGPDCVLACIDALERAQSKQRVLLDDHGLILDEYRKYLSRRGQPGPGDAFFKWLWDNQANPRCCRSVAVTPTDCGGRGFEEFPDDPDLSGFDCSDRKFVATAIASGESPPIVNASDTDWWIFQEILERHRVLVQFVCPELMHEHR